MDGVARSSRAKAQTVICPRCRAMWGKPCVGSRGQSRKAAHVQRHRKYRELRGLRA
jgi:hypothetical protein